MAQEQGARAAPLVIMTSEDTHHLTQQLLEQHDYFGLDRAHLHLLKQANVPALDSNEAAFVTSASDPFKLQTKPHGHGDVHTLLHQSGLLQRFEAEGRRCRVPSSEFQASVACPSFSGFLLSAHLFRMHGVPSLGSLTSLEREAVTVRGCPLLSVAILHCR